VGTFREIVGVVRPGVQYFQQLQAEHQLAWFKVVGARQVARRLFIDWEGCYSEYMSVMPMNIVVAIWPIFASARQALTAISH
jgi:hypothetical protein